MLPDAVAVEPLEDVPVVAVEELAVVPEEEVEVDVDPLDDEVEVEVLAVPDEVLSELLAPDELPESEPESLPDELEPESDDELLDPDDALDELVVGGGFGATQEPAEQVHPGMPQSAELEHCALHPAMAATPPMTNASTTRFIACSLVLFLRRALGGRGP